MKTYYALLLLCALGCGGGGADRASVAGTVTYEGQPIAAGSIAFIPVDAASGPTAGATIENGRYTIDAAQGPAPGAHRVEIKAQRKTGRQFRDEFRPPPDNLVDEVEQFLPPRYNTQSELTATLVPGANEDVDFALQP